MSIISCTSPRPSETILPASSVTRRARSSLDARSSSPSRRTSSPRRGAGTRFQAWKAETARAATSSRSAVSIREPALEPSIGERDGSAPPQTASSTPSRCRMAFASFAAVIVALRSSERLSLRAGQTKDRPVAGAALSFIPPGLPAAAGLAQHPLDAGQAVAQRRVLLTAQAVAGVAPLESPVLLHLPAQALGLAAADAAVIGETVDVLGRTLGAILQIVAIAAAVVAIALAVVLT